jgi:hypothetical protein
MLVESSFVLLNKPLDFAGHNVRLQVSVEVIVPNARPDWNDKNINILNYLNLTSTNL